MTENKIFLSTTLIIAKTKVQNVSVFVIVILRKCWKGQKSLAPVRIGSDCLLVEFLPLSFCLCTFFMCFYIYIAANLGSWPILLDPRKLLTLDAYAVLLLSCPHAHTPSIKLNYHFFCLFLIFTDMYRF